MKRFERLAEAAAPDGTRLVLFRHDGDYLIHVNGVELMSTRRHQSEDLLAELACAPLAAAPAPRVLIGGLGLGFTLRTALRLLPTDAEVVVAELVEEVIDWNAGEAFGISADALRDPRVRLVHGDVAGPLAAPGTGYDAIMLDVDNGAEALTTKGNAALYDDAGIAAAIAALRPGGRVAYWSATLDPAFARAMRRAGLEVQEVPSRAHGGKGARHAIYVGTRVPRRVGVTPPPTPG
jgi:spermidine synthase